LSRRRLGGIGLWDVEGTARGEDRSRISSYLGSGANAFGTERARPKTSERSPPAAAHHKIWQRTGRQETRTRTETGRGGRQSSYRATEPGERERKGNGLHARSPSGAHDHFAERPSSRSKPGGGHWPLAIGCSAAGSQDVASRALGPECLRTLRSESRTAYESHPAVRTKHSVRQQFVWRIAWRAMCAGP